MQVNASLRSHAKKVLGLHHLAKRRIGEFAIKPTDAKLDAKPVARETEFLTDIVGDGADAAVVEDAFRLAIAARNEIEPVAAITDLANVIVAHDPELGFPVLVLDAGKLRADALEDARVGATRQCAEFGKGRRLAGDRGRARR